MQTDVIHTDFSKAFGSGNHQLLLLKLYLIGFPYKLLLWISDYLNSRTLKLLSKTFLSKPFFVTWSTSG